MIFTAAVTQTPQHSFLNGGTGVESRQYSARPTQHTPNGPRITPGIEGMVPGEFRTIWLSAENQLFSTQVEDTGGWYNGLDWTPRAAWNAESQQIVIGMRRGTYKVIAYSDVTGDWRELPTPIQYGRRTGGTAHFYGLIDDRPDGKVLLYSLQNEDFLFDPVTETYEGPRAKHLQTNGSNGSMIAYNGAGEVIKYSGDAKRWLAYNEATDTWTLRASTLPNGMHALLEYNAAADRYLLVGGTLTSQKATLVTPAGVATPVTDCPQAIAMASGSWIAYHPAGCWLVRGWPGGAPGNLYACWPNAAKTDVVWQDLGVAPDNGLTYSTAAVDYDRGMIYIVSTTGLHAYKLPEVTDPSGVVMITGAATTQANASSSGAASSSHSLTGAATAQANASSTGAASSSHSLTGAATAQANASSSGAIGTQGTLSGGSTTQASTTSAGQVIQTHIIIAAAVAADAQASASSVVQTHLLLGSGTIQFAESTAGAVDLTFTHSLSGSAANQTAQAPSGVISQTHLITGSGATSSQVSGTGPVTQVHALAGEGTTQANASTVGATSSNQALQASDVTQLASSGVGAISQAHVLVGAGTYATPVISGGVIGQTHKLLGSPVYQWQVSSTGATYTGVMPYHADLSRLVSVRSGGMADRVYSPAGYNRQILV